MNLLARALVLCVVAACGSPPPAQTPPGPPQPPPPPPTPSVGLDLAQLGQPCGEPGQRCDAPATCVSYYGIAGPRGPEFKSCEVTCADVPEAQQIAPAVLRPRCPDSTHCVTIADGPGAVCRPD